MPHVVGRHVAETDVGRLWLRRVVGSDDGSTGERVPASAVAGDG